MCYDCSTYRSLKETIAMETVDYKLSNKLEKKHLKAFKDANSGKDVEKAVEKATHNLFEDYLNHHPVYKETDIAISYPYNTDGIIEVGNIFSDIQQFSILIEAKRDASFSDNAKDKYGAISQCIFYLRNILLDGHLVPSVVIVVDNDEAFLIPSSVLSKYYINAQYDWTLAPSDAYKETKLMVDLMDDPNVDPVVYTINEHFDVSQFCSNAVAIATGGEIQKIEINKKSLGNAFADFSLAVFGTTHGEAINQATNRQQIELFTRALFNDPDVFVHPKQPNTIMIDSHKITDVNTQGYDRFWSQHERIEGSLEDMKKITEMSDTLIAERNRRNKGDFYTPKPWSDESHETISDSLGDDWRNKYVVWDASSGTGNLTKDYKFSNLYRSTLYDGEIMATSGYNPGSVSFQYDYLNDDMNLHDGSLNRDDLMNMSDEEIEEVLKMPTSLVRDLLDKKPIVFFMNPPYGQATDIGGAKKKGIASSANVATFMDGLGHARGELYTQFFYRTKMLAEFFEYGEDDEFHIFFFSKIFFTSPQFSDFVIDFTKKFSFQEGFMMNAGQFQGASDDWGIIFTHWSLQGEKNQREFTLDVKERVDDEINVISQWTGKTVMKGDTITDWLNEIPLSKKKSDNQILTIGGLHPPKSQARCKLRENWIGYLHNNGNNVQYSGQYTGFYTMGFSGANGRDVTVDNYERTAVVFSIRRTMQERIKSEKELWIRDKDIFTRPSDDLLTDEFIADCVVYSLFDTQSNQTSLRNYQYGGISHRVENPFFPFSTKFINDLAVKHGNTKVQNDITGDSERFVYEWLEENKDSISSEAQSLLDEAKKIYERSFSLRNLYDRITPRYQVNSWDAGWFQINRMVFGDDRYDDYLLDLKDDFKKARRTLGDKIADQVIEDGII